MNWRHLSAAICLLAGLALFHSYAPDVDQHVARNTFLLGLAVNLISIPLGLITAFSCLGRGRFSRLVVLTCLALIFLPLFVHVSAWDAAFGKLGWITGISTEANATVGPWAMAIWIHSMAAIPQVAVITWLGLLIAENIHEERASLDADAMSVFWHITMPKLLPLVGLSIVWNFVVCAREITVTDIYRIGTLAEQIYLGYSLSDFGAISGATTTTLLIAFVAASVFIILLPGVQPSAFSGDTMSSQNRKPAPRWVQSVTAVVLLVLVLAPAINLLARASRKVESIEGEPIVSYSVFNLAEVVIRVPATFADEFCWSAIIATTSTIVLLAVSVLLVRKATKSRHWKLLLIGMTAICCSLPGPLIGSSLLELRSLIGVPGFHWLFDRTIFAPVVANIIFCFPIAVFLTWFVFLNVAADAEESMTIEGAGPITRTIQLIVVANWKILLGTAMIIFAVCFGELSATQLAVPPGIDTIPRRMLGLLHSGVNDHTAGLTIVSVCFILLVISVGFCLYGWQQRNDIE